MVERRTFTRGRRNIDMATTHFPKGLDNRMRDQNGEIRQKRSDTKVATLRETYGDDFAKGYRRGNGAYRPDRGRSRKAAGDSGGQFPACAEKVSRDRAGRFPGADRDRPWLSVQAIEPTVPSRRDVRAASASRFRRLDGSPRYVIRLQNRIPACLHCRRVTLAC